MANRKKPKPEAASEPFVIYPPGSRIGIAWGNGTDAAPEDYAGFHTYLASQGIVVAAATTGSAANGDAIIAAAEELRALGCTRILAVGHSQGAGGALRAARRSSLITAIIPICVNPDFSGSLPVCPAFFITGSADRVSPPPKVQLLVARYPGAAVHGTRLGMNHYGPTGAATAIRKYVAAYILDSTGDEFDRIFSDRNWKTTSQPAD